VDGSGRNAERDRRAEIAVNIRAMVRALNQSEARSFMVLLTRYFIDDVEYVATALTVSPQHTKNLVQTREGFECDAVFDSREVIAQDSQKHNPGDKITVRLCVRLADILQLVPLT
jgi:hypothetical protein